MPEQEINQNTAASSSAEETQLDVKELLQKLDKAQKAYRELQSRTDREREYLKTELASREEQYRQQIEELLKAVGEQPELKANLELAQLRAKATQFDKLREQEERLAQARQQYAQMFDVSEEDLLEAKTPAEAFALARKIDQERLLARLEKERGGSKPESAEESEGEEPPDVNPARGASPDAGVLSESAQEQQLRELEATIRDPNTPKRDKERLRRQWLIMQRRGIVRGRRSQV